MLTKKKLVSTVAVAVGFMQSQHDFEPCNEYGQENEDWSDLLVEFFPQNQISYDHCLLTVDGVYSEHGTEFIFRNFWIYIFDYIGGM